MNFEGLILDEFRSLESSVEISKSVLISILSESSTTLFFVF